MRSKSIRRPHTERFSVGITTGPRKALLVLLGLGGEGLVTVRRAAVRSLEADYAVQAVAQMYRTARAQAPVSVIVCHQAGQNVDSLLGELRRKIGPFADIAGIQADRRYRTGTWGTAVRGAASGLGVSLNRQNDAVAHMARECEQRATGCAAD